MEISKLSYYFSFDEWMDFTYDNDIYHNDVEVFGKVEYRVYHNAEFFYAAIDFYSDEDLLLAKLKWKI